MKPGTRFFPAVAIALACAATPSFADDDSPDSPRELTAQWWQWALSIPAAVNPLTDDTGKYCMVGQRGSVWFLAGTFSDQPVQRTCTIPERVALFFPVLNYFYVNTPACDGIDLSVREARALAAAQMDGATGLSVMLDNRAVPKVQRIRSEVYPAVFPPESLFGGTCPVPGDIYWPGVDDGYYVRLHDLPVGQHYLSFRGTTAGGFTVDVSYTLNVVRTGARKGRG